MAVASVESIINGVSQKLIYNEETGYWEKEITAPSKSSYNVNPEHYYPVTIKAIDSAGNITVVDDTTSVLGEVLKLRVIEKVLPVITASYPSDDAMLIDPLPTISWNVTDDDSGVDPESIQISIDGWNEIKNGISKVPISGGYACSYSVGEQLEDGTHTVYFDASDYDGNKAVRRAVNFTIDTVPPELNVTSPVNNLITNQEIIPLTGTTRDITTGIQSLTVTVNGGESVGIYVGDNGEFAYSLPLTEGTNLVTVRSTDMVGKFTEITRVVILDTAPPIITEIQITPNPVSTEEYLSVACKVTD